MRFNKSYIEKGFWIANCRQFEIEMLLYQSLNLVKSAYQKINFLISHPKHMLWVLKRTVSMRRFF